MEWKGVLAVTFISLEDLALLRYASPMCKAELVCKYLETWGRSLSVKSKLRVNMRLSES